MRSINRGLVSLVTVAVVSMSARAQLPAELNFGFENAAVGGSVPGWFVPTPGFKAEITADQAAEGAQCARLSKSGPDQAPFGNLMLSLGATPYRGRHVVLAAMIRAEGGDGEKARAQMWLRVDRANKQMGAFDNMDDRPILPGDWTKAVIEADVADDGEGIALGFISFDGATVFVDSISLRVTGDKPKTQDPSPPKALSPREVENLIAVSRLLAYVRYFDASDQAVGVLTWDHFAVAAMETAESAADSNDLAHRLDELFGPIAPTLQVWAGAPGDAPALPVVPQGVKGVSFWKHNGVRLFSKHGPPGSIYSSSVERSVLDEAPSPGSHAEHFVVRSLGGGVSCRLTIKTCRDDEGTLPHGKTPAIWSKPADHPVLGALNRSTRLAGVATAWGVFQHFYPYFDVVKTDWDAALPEALKKASQDSSEIDYLHTLRELVAKLHDGHGGVFNESLQPTSFFPLALAWVGGDLVVIAKADTVPETVTIGDILISIDGRTSHACHDEILRLISAATEGWRRWRSSQRIIDTLPTADPAAMVLRHPGGEEYTVQLARANALPVNAAIAKKPENGSELTPGIVYFDLRGAESDALKDVMDKLSAAKGIVFDMRGYPATAAYEVIQHLIDENATSAHWNVPIATRPDREGWEWSTAGRWDMPPLEPRWKMPVAFMTSGGAISYAESIMGIVEHYRLGEIVGSTTAGTNGNVNPFDLPGGFTVSWTGMQVLKHDGSRHHGVGISPTVPIEPTAKGIAEGRDEVLEKAIEVLKAKIAAETR